MSGERVVPPAKADVKDFERRLSATAVMHDAADVVELWHALVCGGRGWRGSHLAIRPMPL